MSSIIRIQDLRFTEYVTPDAIADRVSAIGKALDERFKGVDSIITIITLKGAFMFAADLIRTMHTPMYIDMVKASSYKGGVTSTGTVTLSGFTEEFEGKHILIIEDIVDSGRTIYALLDALKDRNIASCTITALCSKPSQHDIDISQEFVGFEFQPVFIVGYGLDYKEMGRELPGIWRCID
ncbi:MAG: hypoxanthine phosphoribosyltransferase [Ignavibacteria bacterium]|nr:hypoxanthine phosphoribosyltransferase [Ignavibacteria bacterium]